MTLTAPTILLFLMALFLSVATLWPFSYADPKESDPRLCWVLIAVVVPFVMLLYFGIAFIISDKINEGSAWPVVDDVELSVLEGLIATVTFVGLSGWLLLRRRKPTAPSTRILGPAIIATLTAFIIISVVWAEHYDQYFTAGGFK